MSQPRLPWEDPSSQVPEQLPVPAEPLPVPAPAPAPRPASGAPLPDDLANAVRDALAQAAVKAEQVAEAVVKAQLGNQTIEVSTTTMTGQKFKLADAKNRAFRTLFQNLAVDLLVALGTVLPMLLNMDFTDKAAWSVFGISVAKTVINVFVSYVSRLSTDPVIPTPMETPSGIVVQPPPDSHAEG